MSGKSPLALSTETLGEIFAHASSGYPEEVCGLVVGGLARRCENRQNALHAEDPETFPRDARTAYNLGPKDLLFLARSFDTAEPVRIIYHSHVDVGAYFSDEDVRAAAPDGELAYPVDYLVVDAQKSGAKEARLYRFEAGSFVEIARYPR